MTRLVKMVVRWHSNPPTETNVEEPTVQLPIDALKEWTGKTRATVIFDSTVDEFTDNGLFTKVKGKQNIALVGFTTKGDVFGGFYSVAVTGQYQWFFNDPTIFAFSFESHGRCVTPQRFAVGERLKKKAFVRFNTNNNGGFVWFRVDGVSHFFLGNERSDSWCWNLSCGFEGLENTTLTGQNNTDWKHPPYHHCARLVAILLE